jgi:hypothetical protein
MKESMNVPRPPSPPTPQQTPQQYLQNPPSAMLQNPIPHQGVMNTQHEVHPSPPKMGKYQNLGPIHPLNLVDLNILLTSEEDILLQMRDHQYGTPPNSAATTSEESPSTAGQPLMIPCPNVEPTICIPHIPLRWNVNHPQAREAHNYSLVNDLAQYHVSMSVLEVLQMCPTQWKSFLSSLGVVDPADARLITFYLDSREPHLPALVAF